MYMTASLFTNLGKYYEAFLYALSLLCQYFLHRRFPEKGNAIEKHPTLGPGLQVLLSSFSYSGKIVQKQTYTRSQKSRRSASPGGLSPSPRGWVTRPQLAVLATSSAVHSL